MLDNYVTSGLQEDHLSLGTGAALKLLRLLNNLWQVLAIEYLLAAQALDFHGEAQLASGTGRYARCALRLLPAGGSLAGTGDSPGGEGVTDAGLLAAQCRAASVLI